MVKFSIITATFNSERTLKNCLDSVNNLYVTSEFDFEHLIIDGGSKDNTLNIIQEYSKHNPKSFFLSEADNGIYDAFNKGIELSNGDYILFLHSDDTFAYKNILLDYYEVLKDKTFKIDIIYSDLHLINSNGKVIRRWRPGKFHKFKLFYGWMPPHPTILIHRSLFGVVGLFDTSYRISADFEFVLRLLHTSNLKSYYLPKLTYLMGTEGVSNNNFTLKIKEDFRVLNGYYNFFVCISILVLKRVYKLNQFSV